MSEPPSEAPSERYAAALVVRRVIHATAEKLFAAWTQPEQLVEWWGPEGVACPAAQIDLRPGGAYRIANRFSDGTLVWIAGVFEVVERPHRLVYTWQLEPASTQPLDSPATRSERVTVCFVAHDASTEVIVTHERIGDETARTGHERGWTGCLEGLARYMERLQEIGRRT
jgi:uncharacterized protein YndB with AHSA1/START domain